MSPPTWPGKGGLKEAPSVRPAAVTASGAHPHTHRTPSPALTAAPHSNLAKGPGASPQGFPPALPAPPRPAAPRAPPLPQQKEQGSFQKHKHPSAGKWNSPSTPVPCGSRSRHFHLPGPAGGAPPPGEDGSARLPSAGRNPRASMEGPARHLHIHTRAGPPAPRNGRVQPATLGPHNGRSKVPVCPYLCSASSSSRGLPPPPPSPAARPCSLPRDWRPPTGKCPNVTPPLWKPSPPPPLPQG